MNNIADAIIKAIINKPPTTRNKIVSNTILNNVKNILKKNIIEMNF